MGEETKLSPVAGDLGLNKAKVTGDTGEICGVCKLLLLNGVFDVFKLLLTVSGISKIKGCNKASLVLSRCPAVLFMGEKSTRQQMQFPQEVHLGIDR